MTMQTNPALTLDQLTRLIKEKCLYLDWNTDGEDSQELSPQDHTEIQRKKQQNKQEVELLK